MERVFPTTAMQAMASGIDDDLARWNERTNEFRPEALAHGQSCVKRLGELIAAIGEFRDRLDEQVRGYGRRG